MNILNVILAIAIVGGSAYFALWWTRQNKARREAEADAASELERRRLMFERSKESGERLERGTLNDRSNERVITGVSTSGDSGDNIAHNRIRRAVRGIY